MTGSIRQRCADSWELRVHLGVDPERGQERWASKTVHGTRRHATACLAEGRMQAFLDRHGYTGRVPAATLVERLRTHLLSATAGSIEGHRFSALALVDQLGLVNRQLKAFDLRTRVRFRRACSSALCSPNNTTSGPSPAAT
jgi:hypothetical protein